MELFFPPKKSVLCSCKKEGNLTNDTTWMNLEDIMLSKASQSQKDKGCMIPFIWAI